MRRMVSSISDRMLGLVAPKIEADACTVRFVGCCDFCVCNFCCLPDGNCWCSNCSCSRC